MVMTWPFQSTTALTTCRIAARERLSAKVGPRRPPRRGPSSGARRTRQEAEPAGAELQHPGQGEQARDLVEPRGGDRPDQRGDLGAETSGGDEHEALGALGELVGELHRHAAAEAVAHHGDPVDAEHRQQVAHAVGVAADAVVGPGLVGLAVPEQVGGDDRVAPRERLDDGVPGRVVTAEAVQEQQRGSRPGAHVGAAVPVDPDVLDLHATSCARMVLDSTRAGFNQNLFHKCRGPVPLHADRHPF